MSSLVLDRTPLARVSPDRAVERELWDVAEHAFLRMVERERIQRDLEAASRSYRDSAPAVGRHVVRCRRSVA